MTAPGWLRGDQGAVILVGAVRDANNGHTEAAIGGGQGEFAVLGQDDQLGIDAGRRHLPRRPHSPPAWPPGCPAGRAVPGGRPGSPW